MHSATLHELSAERAEQIRNQLLSWYGQHARELPWRLPAKTFGLDAYDAYVARLYRCLLSETMLQQTQVKTVIAYYTKWLLKFPTLEELAEANEEDVMACWAGLGYYSRAKRLQQAAKHLVSNFVLKRLEFPRDAEYWVKHVPGVGPYTAGAILSIAFDIPSAIVDGNVQRVLSRVLAIHGDTSTPKSAGVKLVWGRAAQLVVGEHPGDFNQSLMELGATICTPTLPQCPNCPVSNQCSAYEQMVKLKSNSTDLWSRKSAKSKSAVEDDIEDLCDVCPTNIDESIVQDKITTYIQSLYPFKPQKKKQREEIAIVIIVQDKHNKIYLEKKAKGLLAGLYDFPTILIDAGQESTCDELIAKHKRKVGAKHVGESLHLFTHIRRTSHVLVCDSAQAVKLLAAFAEVNETGKWVEAAALPEIGVSELCLKNWRVASGEVKSKKRAQIKAIPKDNVKRKRSGPESDIALEHMRSELPLPDSGLSGQRIKKQTSIMTMFPKRETEAIT